jgi:thiol peroxidase
MERTGIYELGGKGVTIVGPDLELDSIAPDFTVIDNDWNDVKALESTTGKVRILAAVPSLSTGVCDRETRRFNEEAAALGEDVAILTISHDLPFTQKNWCGAAGVERVKTLSDARDAEFGEKYGALIKERRILRRAVFVVDRAGKVVYSDYMPALGDEPNYEDVIAAAKSAL